MECSADRTWLLLLAALVDAASQLTEQYMMHPFAATCGLLVHTVATAAFCQGPSMVASNNCCPGFCAPVGPCMP